jgi:branched-chain amino acid transport system ATP-binding protein
MSDKPHFSVRDLYAGYGHAQVLHGVSLDAAEGEFITVVGSNGAGKTTLLKAIMGLVRSVGDMDLGGQPFGHEPAYRRASLGIGYVPEGRNVFTSLTVEENLRLTAKQGGRSKDGGLAAMEHVYGLFPRLRERRRQPAQSLSGGEQQMLAIGRALALSPSILIVDEVSQGLAPVVVERIFEVFVGMRAQGTTILLAEQNALMALEAADKAYVLDNGRVTLAGPAADLRRDKRVVEAYIQNF